MTEVVQFLVPYIFGLLTGIGLCLIVLLHYSKKVIDAASDLSSSKDLTSKAKTLTVSERMKRVQAITEEQLSLSRSIDGPQKNSLDGKYKNSLINKTKALNDEKDEILRSILNDGFDPELSAMDESGVVTQMKLSEYMAYMGIKMKPKNKPVAQTPEAKAERLAKFTLHKGGKSDGGNNTTH